MPLGNRASPRYRRPTFSSQARADEQQFLNSSLEPSEASDTEAKTLLEPDLGVPVAQQTPSSGESRTNLSSSDQSDFEADKTPKPPKVVSATVTRTKQPSLRIEASANKALASGTSKMEGIMEAVPFFYGKKDGYEDPQEHLETLDFIVDEKHPDDAERQAKVKRMVFRSRLKDEALKWYQRLEPNIRSDWDSLSAAFSSEFELEERVDTDPNKFFNQFHSLKQGKKSIAQYVTDAQSLYTQCPEELRALFGNQFIAGIADEGKLDMVQLYLSHETKVTFPIAKAAVIKAYSRIGRPSPFNPENETTKDEITQNSVTVEMYKFFSKLNTAEVPARKTVIHEYKPVVPPAAANSDVICHNCLSYGHYSTECPQPQVSYKIKSANRAKAEEMQGQKKGLPQQAPAATAASVQFYRNAFSQAIGAAYPKARGPLNEVTGNSRRTLNKMPTSNVTILRRNQHQQDEAVAAQAAAANRPKKTKDVPATENPLGVRESRVQKPVDKNDPSKTAQQAAKQVTAKQGTTNRQPGFVEEMDVDATPNRPRTPSPPRADVEAITPPRTTRYLPPIEPTPAPIIAPAPPVSAPTPVPDNPFEEDEAAAIRQSAADLQTGSLEKILEALKDNAKPSEPQRKVAKPKETDSTPKETIPINMAKDKSRFTVDGFLDAEVTMPIWQLLDRSPQIRAQLARAMASSKPTKRGKRAAPTSAAQTFAAQEGPPAVATEAHDEEDGEVKCLYLEVWVGNTKVAKTLVDNGAVVELINPALVKQLGLEVFEMEETWTLQMADDGLATVHQYAWVPVNVAGVFAMVKAFILGMGNVFDLLLSKRWMRRVRAVEDHGKASLIVEGKDGVQRVAHGKIATPLGVELADSLSVNEWETGLAEEEIARLIEELDKYDFTRDQGKDQRQ